MSTWAEELEEAMAARGESLSDLLENTLTADEMNGDFCDGYCYKAFTAWSAKTVYFPLVYDNCYWVGSVSRDPDGIPTEAQGS